MNTPSDVFSSPKALWCLTAAMAWLLTSWVYRRLRRPEHRLATSVVRVGVSTAFWLMLIQITTELIPTTAPCPLWILSLTLGIVSETILWSYNTESRSGTPSLRKDGAPPATYSPLGASRVTPENTVNHSDALHASAGSRFLRTIMPAARLVTISVVGFMLLQPTLSRESVHREERTVAVVVDTSDSMILPARRYPTDEQNRSEIARQLLTESLNNGTTLPEELQLRYNVEFYQMGTKARRLLTTDESTPETLLPAIPNAQSSSTKMSAALRRISGDLPLETLSGIIFLTDGCDHSDADLQAAVAGFRNQQIPVNSVVIGSQSPVKDAEVVNLQASPQLFRGDELTLAAVIRADQFSGQSATLRLFEGEQLIESRQVSVTSARHREAIQFRHQPDEARMHNYRVDLVGLDADATPENNTAESQVWVTDDRIRILMIESRPRWEFRYLRNLFSGRDKSVFLQAVLLNPDRLAGVPAPLPVRASALRAFDDCDANELPADISEWLKFDVIILGDVSPDQLGPNGMEAIDTFIREKGGTLVAIAGPLHMPHQFETTALRNLLPAELDGQLPTSSPTTPVQLRLTADGLQYAALQKYGLNPDRPRTAFPDLSWQHPSRKAKPGTTVLAYAADGAPGGDGTDSDGRQRQNALMLWHRVGAGRVLQMNFDESWRLRYGIGDQLHHQFWGSIVRWSTSDRLTAGTDRVRMGTDRVLYRPGDPIIIRARVLDALRNPVSQEPIKAALIRNGESLQAVQLLPDPERTGFLIGRLPEAPAGGTYRIELSGDSVRRSLQLDAAGTDTIGLEITVRQPPGSRESLDIAADATVPGRIADWTGGIVTSPDDVQSIFDTLGPSSSYRRQRSSTPLWTTWPVILTFLSSLTVEWSLRRLTGRL